MCISPRTVRATRSTARCSGESSSRRSSRTARRSSEAWIFRHGRRPSCGRWPMRSLTGCAGKGGGRSGPPEYAYLPVLRLRLLGLWLLGRLGVLVVLPGEVGERPDPPQRLRRKDPLDRTVEQDDPVADSPDALGRDHGHGEELRGADRGHLPGELDEWLLHVQTLTVDHRDRRAALRGELLPQLLGAGPVQVEHAILPDALLRKESLLW